MGSASIILIGAIVRTALHLVQSCQKKTHSSISLSMPIGNHLNLSCQHWQAVRTIHGCAGSTHLSIRLKTSCHGRKQYPFLDGHIELNLDRWLFFGQAKVE